MLGLVSHCVPVGHEQTGEAARSSLDPHPQILRISALPRNHRRMVRLDTFGFPKGSPKGYPKGTSNVKGFRTGDLVKAVVPTGTKRGIWYGRVAVRATGNFKVGQRDGIPVRYLAKLQHNDPLQAPMNTPTVDPHPFDVTLDCRRAHRHRTIKRQLAWFATLLTMLQLCVALGVLIAASNSILFAFLSVTIILAGIHSARYLLTR